MVTNGFSDAAVSRQIAFKRLKLGRFAARCVVGAGAVRHASILYFPQFVAPTWNL